MKVIVFPTRKERTDNIQEAWDPEILVSVITTVGVPVDEALSDIVMNARIEVIHLEYSCEEACIY